MPPMPGPPIPNSAISSGAAFGSGGGDGGGGGSEGMAWQGPLGVLFGRGLPDGMLKDTSLFNAELKGMSAMFGQIRGNSILSHVFDGLDFSDGDNGSDGGSSGDGGGGDNSPFPSSEAAAEGAINHGMRGGQSLPMESLALLTPDQTPGKGPERKLGTQLGG